MLTLLIKAVFGFVCAMAAAAPSVDERLQRLEAEVRRLKSAEAMYPRDAYIRGGLSLLRPRANLFGFKTDTGLGAFVGAGKYIGDSPHALEAVLEWDYYLGAALRYRYEWRLPVPSLTLSPVVGIKAKLLGLRPFDSYLQYPERVQNFFVVTGAMMQIPLGNSVGAIELLYVFNDQAFIVGNVAVHLGL